MDHPEEKILSYQSFLDSLNSRSIVFSNSDKIVYRYNHVNKKYDFMGSGVSKIIGYTLEELNEKGLKSILKRIIIDNKDSFEIDYGEGKKEKVEEYFAKYQIKTKNGNLIWLEDNSFITYGKDKKRLYSIGVLRDITSFHNFIDDLHDEKKKLNDLLDLAEVIFIALDKNRKVKYINLKGCNILGYERNEIIGKDWFENFIPPNKRDELYEIFNKSFLNKAVPLEFYENSVLTKTGEERVIGWRNSLIRDDVRHENYLISSGEDITYGKKQEKIQHIISQILEYTNSESNLDELFKFIHISVKKLMLAENFYIALYDKESNLIHFPYFIDEIEKEAPPKRFGKGLTEYILKTGESLLCDKEKDNELVESGETEIMGAQSAIWLGIPLKIQESTIGVIAVQDYNNEKTYGEREKEILEVISYPISRAIERKRVQQERDELIDKLKELVTSKDKLFSLISHDLRSPFNSLLGFSEILTTEYESLTDEEIKEYLKVIYEASKNLYGMTTNLLQYSRFQMGRFEFKPVKLNLKKIINNNIKLLKGNILKKQLNILTNLDVSPEIFADEDMINSAIQNLLSNAIKFTNQGGDINISLDIIKFFDKPSQVEIKIEDSGVGISKDDLEKISKNQMFSNSGTDREYGTGLGLLLVKEFIEKNRGTIKISSKVNQGTTIIFRLPISD